MKKLMIAAVAIALAAVAQAATVDWMAEGISALASGSSIVDSKVYAFETTSFSQDMFLALFAVNDDSWTSNATLADLYEDGAAMGSVGGYDNGAATSTWLAIFDTAGNVLVSNSEIDTIGGAGQSAAPYFDLTDASTAGIFKASDGFNAAGWYSAAAVPEPTSALMLLVGLAGLALKRKVA